MRKTAWESDAGTSKKTNRHNAVRFFLQLQFDKAKKNKVLSPHMVQNRIQSKKEVKNEDKSFYNKYTVGKSQEKKRKEKWSERSNEN